MRHLIVGDKIEFDIIHSGEGIVNATSGGIEIGDLFRAVLDVNEFPTVELSGYVRDEDGKLISIYELNEDDHPELTGAKKEARKFIISGKIELTLIQEVCDEASEEHLGISEESV